MRWGACETGDYRHYPISNYHDHMKRLKLQRAKFTLAFSKMTFPANVKSELYKQFEVNTNNLKSTHRSHILPDDITDHFPITTTIPNGTKETRIDIKHRVLSPRNIQKFQNYCMQQSWGEILNDNNAQTAYTALHEKINYIYNKSFPWNIDISNYKNKLPWINATVATQRCRGGDRRWCKVGGGR